MGLFDVLTAVGGLGLELAGTAAKVTGKLAAEGVKNALGSGGLKLTESNSNTRHEYIDWTMDDVSSDSDYMAMFKRAMEEIVEKRTYDDYVGAIGGCEPQSANVLSVGADEKTSKMIEWCFTFDGIRVYDETTKDVRNETRTIRVVIQTPNARQLSWNGEVIQKGYVISSTSRRGVNNQKQLVKAAPFESFLGVMFKHDYHEFPAAIQSKLPCIHKYVDLKDVEEVNVKANPFLEFTKSRAIIATSHLVPDWKDKVVGLICSVDLVENADELMKKTRAVLQHKYQGEWGKKDRSGLFELGTRYLYSMHINGGDVYLTQTKEGAVELMAISSIYESYCDSVKAAYMETEEYKQKVASEQAKEAERIRLEKERQAEKDQREKARKEAEELKKKEQEEKAAAQRAEFTNALDAL